MTTATVGPHSAKIFLGLEVAAPRSAALEHVTKQASDNMHWLTALASAHRKLKSGEMLYQIGSAMESLYVVRHGCFKSELVLEDGRLQVIDFHLTGDLLGLDAIATDEFASSAIALKDSEVGIIPFPHIVRHCAGDRRVAQGLNCLLGAQIVRRQQVMLMLGQMSAEQRLAAFVLQWAQRLECRGRSATSVHLCMSREEIGSYLGLKLETVSRGLQRLQRAGMIRIENNRDVTVCDRCELRRTVFRCERPGQRLAA